MRNLTEREFNLLSPEQRARYLEAWRNRRGGGQSDNGDVPQDIDQVSTPGSGVNISPKEFASKTGSALYDATIGRVPAVGASLKSGVQGYLRGDSGEEIAKDALKSGAISGGKFALDAAGLPFAGPTVNTIKDTFNKNPNTKASLIGNFLPSFAQGLGSTINPIFGAAAGGLVDYATQDSLESGIIGDVIDSRHQEMARDDLEDQGYSRSESEDILATDIDMANSYSMGYDANSRQMKARNETTNPNVSNRDPQADNPSHPSPPTSLAKYVSNRGENSGSGGSQSASQSQGDYGDRGSVAGGKGGV